jgi:DNA-binding XRE family transcriptional regulator
MSVDDGRGRENRGGGVNFENPICTFLERASALMDMKDDLQKARSILKLSQEKAGHRIGVSLNTYRCWENGTSTPNVENWKAIQKFIRSSKRLEDKKTKTPSALF